MAFKEYNPKEIEFKGKKRFLSNMYPAPLKMDLSFKDDFPEFKFDGLEYGSSEHLYQALKSNDKNWHKLIRETEKPTKTKSLAHKLLGKDFEIREDWNKVKDSAMKLCLRLKFTYNLELYMELLDIEGKIEERNDWNDTYWGTCHGVGENKLGIMLMELRDK